MSRPVGRSRLLGTPAAARADGLSRLLAGPDATAGRGGCVPGDVPVAHPTVAHAPQARFVVELVAWCCPPRRAQGAGAVGQAPAARATSPGATNGGARGRGLG